MEEYKIVEGKPEDGLEMLELIEKTPSKGKLELFYTRRPNAYISYMEESKYSEVYIVRDEEEKIAFQFGIVTHKYHLENEIKKIGYVGGLRKNPDFKGKLDWKYMLYKIDKDLHDYHDYYCSILNDNVHAKKVIVKKKENWPTFEELCQYDTNIFNPKVFIKKNWDNDDYKLEQVNKKNLKEVYKFIHKEGDKYNFFPEIKELTDFKDLKIEDCYILKKNDEIVAFTALWNQGNYKQYVVKKYHFPLNVLKKFSFIFEKLGYIPFPKDNETFKFYHLSFFLVKDNNIDIYKTFIHKLCKEVKNKTKALVIGINNDTIQKEIYDNIKKLNFKSTIYYAYFGKGTKLTKDNYIECALL